MQFPHKMRFLHKRLSRLTRTSKGHSTPSGDNNQSRKRRPPRTEGPRKVAAMTAQIVEDRVRSGPETHSLEDWECLEESAPAVAATSRAPILLAWTPVPRQYCCENRLSRRTISKYRQEIPQKSYYPTVNPQTPTRPLTLERSRPLSAQTKTSQKT